MAVTSTSDCEPLRTDGRQTTAAGEIGLIPLGTKQTADPDGPYTATGRTVGLRSGGGTFQTSLSGRISQLPMQPAKINGA
jgi:hypothetical protein